MHFSSQTTAWKGTDLHSAPDWAVDLPQAITIFCFFPPPMTYRSFLLNTQSRTPELSLAMYTFKHQKNPHRGNFSLQKPQILKATCCWFLPRVCQHFCFFSHFSCHCLFWQISAQLLLSAKPLGRIRENSWFLLVQSTKSADLTLYHFPNDCVCVT